MKRAAFVLMATLILAGAALAADLAPGVVLLAAIKRHMKEELDRLPNVSCVETVRREFRPAKGRMKPFDTVRLEVHTDGQKEFYASPGEREFSSAHPMDYAGSGVMVNGFFGMHLKNVLGSTDVTFDYKGEEEIAGRRLARYDYRVSEMFGGQSFNLPEGSGTAALHGSIWADPRTYDVIRLEMDAGDFPPAVPLTEAMTRIDYARIAFDGGASLLLPASGEFRMVKVSGETSHNQIEFTDCRLFQARSELSFNEPGSPAAPTLAAAAPSTNENRRTLPAGLRIDVKLNSRITGKLAVGGLIEGVVTAAVRQDGSVLVAANSPVHGRIRRLEQRTDPEPYFIVALEFTEVESQGIRYRFFADLIELGSAPGVEVELSSGSTESHPIPGGFGARIEKRKWDKTWLPGLPGVASFFVTGGDLDLLPGFRTAWRTRTATP
jgi:hypothetical protein